MLRLIAPLATMLLTCLFALPAMAGPFVDVPRSWVSDQIDKLQSEGFIEGYPDGTVRLGNLTTRYEMAMIFARIQDRLDSEIDSFSLKVPESPLPVVADEFRDVSRNHWARIGVERLRLRGAVIGYPDQTFRGNDLLTRGQIKLVILRTRDEFGSMLGKVDPIKVESRLDRVAPAYYSDLLPNHWAYRSIVTLAMAGVIHTRTE